MRARVRVGRSGAAAGVGRVQLVLGVPAATIRDLKAGEKTWHINAYIGTNMKKSLQADERIAFSCNQDRCVVCVKCVLVADSWEDALARAVDAGALPGQLFKGAQTLQDVQAALRASASFMASPPAVAFRIEKMGLVAEDQQGSDGEGADWRAPSW